MEKEKKVFKIFLAWQDNKEEEWLNQMAKEGWELKKYNLLYHFKRIEPTDYIYKMDYKPGTNYDREEYLTLFKDAGWEYVTQIAGWQYFRTLSDSDSAPDIFSDNESKIQKYNTLLKTLGLAFFFVFFLSFNVIFNISTGFSWISKMAYSVILLMNFIALWKVRNKIKLLKE